MSSKQKEAKGQITKEESIYKRFPEPRLNNTTLEYLGESRSPDKKNKSVVLSLEKVIFQGGIGVTL